MGTRGLWGFAADGVTKYTYNHSDSYPSGLGVDVAHWVQANSSETAWPAAFIQFVNLQPVQADDEPTYAQAEEVAAYSNSGVSTGTDWYSALRRCQGDIGATLASGYIVDGGNFAGDSLFCEWGYIVSFDTKQIEVYKGFVKEPHEGERFSGLSVTDPGGYYPIRLHATLDVDDPELVEKMMALEVYE